MSQTGESGEVVAESRVHQWKEIKTTKQLEGVKREKIPDVIKLIQNEVKLEEGADKFGEILEKMFTDTTSLGATTNVLGDLNADTMIFAIFYCIEDASDNDKINIAYVINTLSTDLPRKDTSLHIAVVKDFAHKNLTEKLIEHLTKDSEAELKNMTEAWPKRELKPAARVPRDAGDGDDGMETPDFPAIIFKCASKEGDKLEVTVVSCKGLPDLDGVCNLSDPYVVVKVGSKKVKTEAVRGNLNPTFEEETSTFLFDDISELALQSRIRFGVWDKDTISSDDLIGKTSIKIDEVDKTGKTFMLELKRPQDGEKQLTDCQMTAIVNLFSVLDPNGTGFIPPETSALVAKNHTKEAVLLTELKAFIDEKRDKDGDGKVSFGEFQEAFRVHEDPGNAEEINMLAEEFKLLKSAQNLVM
jgi:Ca2+-binding EF-hand superfamily protein